MLRWRENSHLLCTAAPAWNELLFGCHRLPPSRRRQDLRDFIEGVLRFSLPILPYDRTSAEWHAVQRGRLGKIGRTPPFLDGQIAAIASTGNLILVTRNLRDFSGFDGLMISDWTQGDWRTE